MFPRPPGRFRLLSPARSQKTAADNFVHMHSLPDMPGGVLSEKIQQEHHFQAFTSPESWH